MKAISVQQPFAHWILCGEKNYEYRTWNTDHRGELLICSSANPKVEDTIMGHALCIVNVTDVIQVTRKNYKDLELDEPPARGENLYAWKLEDVKIIKPFPVKGKLNFYYIDDELIEIIDDGSDKISEEEANELVEKYIIPLLYKPKNKRNNMGVQDD